MVLSMKLQLAIVVCTLLGGGFVAATHDVRFEPLCRPANEGRIVRLLNETGAPLAVWQCTGNGARLLNCGNTTTTADLLCDQPPHGRDNASPDVPFQCPPDGIEQFPLRGNCTHYNWCFGGAHAVRACAVGMHFDAERGGCNFAHLANCRRDWCPVGGVPGVRVTFPSETACGEFYMCYDGEPEPFECLAGLHWNQQVQACDLPENAGCKIEPTTTESPPSPPPPPPPPPPPTCPSAPGVHQLPHASDCAQFYVCNGDGIAHPMHCPLDLEFDPEIGQCNRPENFQCAHRRAAR